MPTRFNNVVVDCSNPQTLAQFWSKVLGYKVVGDDEDEVMIAETEHWEKEIREGPVAPTLLFIRVPELKMAKNRLHIDLRPVDLDQDQEVARIVALGGRRVDIGQREQTWVVLADPEDNEFCVLRTLGS